MNTFENLQVILNLVFENDPETQEEVKQELGIEGCEKVEQLLINNPAIVEFSRMHNGVPFPGDEEDFDAIMHTAHYNNPEEFQLFCDIVNS